jgi:thymidylate kinase
MDSLRRIDFLGPSGVGKSTLYYELVKQRDKNEKWMTPKELKVKIAQRESKKYTHSIVSRLRAVIFNLWLFKPIYPQLTETVLTKYEYKNLVLWEEREEKEAIDTVIQSFALIPSHPFFKLHRYKRIFEFAQQIAVFQKYAPPETTVVIDNSLTNEMSFLGPWNSDEDIRNLDSYIYALGKISGVIFLDADDNLVLERLKKRMALFVNIAHRGMNDLELTEDTRRRLESARQLATMLEKQGVAVARVNSGDPLDKQVRLARDFIKQQSQPDTTAI